MTSRWTKIITIVLVGCSSVLASPSPIRTPAHEAYLHRRDTASVDVGDQGTFVGNVVGDQVQFYGIPFAQPPQRFRAAEAVEAYSGRASRDATQTGHVCWQNAYGYKPPVLDEDCLVLNVYKPLTATASSKLPVMLWIHGGGWQIGSSILTSNNATNLVDAAILSNQPIIFVAIQYRLGAFGFLGGQEVANASKAGDFDLNVGLSDQRLALQWVQKYISYFGGDQKRVTAFGQSAGAASVSAQMIANGGKLNGLFTGAIMQSGSAANYPRFYPDAQRPQQVYSDLLDASNCTNLSCLEALDAVDLNTAQGKVISKWVSPFVPVIDPVFYALPPSFAFAAGAVADIPFIAGTVLDDGTFIRSARNVSNSDDFASFLSLQFGNRTGFGVDLLEQLYPADPAQGCPFRTDLFGVPASDPLYSAQYKRTAAVVNDLLFLSAKRMQLYGTVLNTKTKSKAWSYLFAQRSAGNVAGTGITHGSDVAYVFARPPTSATAPPDDGDELLAVAKTSTQESIDMFAQPTDINLTSQMMVASWLAFAYNRDPNVDGVPNWPAYDMDSMASMQWQGSNTTVIKDDFRKLQTDAFLANPLTWWI